MKDPIIFIDEAANYTDKEMKKLNRMIERSKYIGKNNRRGRLRYRWAKLRGRTNGQFFWSGK